MSCVRGSGQGEVQAAGSAGRAVSVLGCPRGMALQLGILMDRQENE